MVNIITSTWKGFMYIIKRGKIALFIALAAVGLSLMVDALIGWLPAFASNTMKFTIGFVILLLVGFLGYNIFKK